MSAKKAAFLITGIFMCTQSLFGCASHGVNPNDRNSIIIEHLALVQSVDEVRFDSDVPEAALFWGLHGVLDNVHGDRHDMFAGAIVGALFGSVLTAAFEGSNQGYEYHLLTDSGEFMTVVLDYYPAQQGECVVVRMGSQVDIYATDIDLCESLGEGN